MKIAILTGPTATGKTSLALSLAERSAAIEIINADSMLVYRGMDVGTAKPTPEELKRVPHHLIDIRDPAEAFAAGDFVRAAEKAIQDIQARGKQPLIVGGTGFYLKALLYGLWEAPAADPGLRARMEQQTADQLFLLLQEEDPDAAARIGKSDRYRLIRALEVIVLTGKTPTELQNETSRTIDPRFQVWIVDRSDEELQARIHQRTQKMLEQGLVDEVKRLRAKSPEARSLKAVGYSQTCDWLDGKAPDGRKIRPGLEGLSDEIELATRQLVKSQRTWFRGQYKDLEGKPGMGWFFLENDRSVIESLFDQTYGAR